MTGTDDALQTLLLPFSSGQLQWNEDALFLRARCGAALSSVADKHLICEQSFKPEAELLQRAGFNVSPELPHDEAVKFSLVLILPPRQRDEARSLFARAISSLKSGGVVIAAASNNDGARSQEDDLAKLAGTISTHSKNKCRVFWAKSNQGIDKALLKQWLALDEPRPILSGRYISRPGVFAWDRIDVASALLAKHLPSDLDGLAADLGAGFGYLSDELLQRCPGVKSVHVYEAEHRALQLSKLNLAKYESRASIEYHWHDVTAGLLHKYDVIISNPPFHVQGGMDRPDVGRRFISVAAQSLNPGGKLFIVANRHLPYEEALAEGFDSVNVVTQQQGFKVIAATKKPAESRRTRK